MGRAWRLPEACFPGAAFLMPSRGGLMPGLLGPEPGPQDVEFARQGNPVGGNAAHARCPPGAMHAENGRGTPLGAILPCGVPGARAGRDPAGEFWAVVDAFLVDLAMEAHPCLAAKDRPKQGTKTGDGQPIRPLVARRLPSTGICGTPPRLARIATMTTPTMPHSHAAAPCLKPPNRAMQPATYPRQ